VSKEIQGFFACLSRIALRPSARYVSNTASTLAEIESAIQTLSVQEQREPRAGADANLNEKEDVTLFQALAKLPLQSGRH
jgi:hypothetical protein